MKQNYAYQTKFKSFEEKITGPFAYWDNIFLSLTHRSSLVRSWKICWRARQQEMPLASAAELCKSEIAQRQQDERKPAATAETAEAEFFFAFGSSSSARTS